MKNKTGKVIVFLIFLIFLLQVFIPVVNAQTPTPPTRDSLIQAIQQRAQKDVELGAAPQSPTDLAVLFSEQASSVGMSMNEVKDIYDEAYKNATPVKSPWDDLFKPQGGWIFLIIGGLLVILGNIAKDYITSLGKKLAEHAYQRLARFRPFWMIALRRYRKSLESIYRELKIPFRSGRPLQMQDIYVPLRVDGGSKQQVDAYQTIQGQKRLIVLGDPGSGKTMLMRHIAFTYARQGLYDFPGQPIPVYLELNRVENAENSLLNALTKTLENHNFPGANGFLTSALENKSLLILLDGLDEVNAPSRLELIKQVKDLYQKYPENRIILTCRNAVYQGEMDDWVDQKLEIIEFSDQQIQRFMTSWQKDMPADKSIEHFIRTLQERPQIMALARNPLLLTMVAYLYTDTEFALPHSRSEFYSRSTDLLLDQWKLDRNRYKATHKRIVLQKLAIFNQIQSGKTGERRTMELADVMKEVRDILPDLTLKTEDAQPVLDEIVQRSGLMLVVDGGQRYQFTHLTLQEYFAARALETEPRKLLDSYQQNPDSWREVMRLWCALEHDSTTMLKDLYGIDPLIAFECLSDAQKVDSAYADELLQSFQPRLNEALTNDSLASAFALLATDPRQRGKTWFEFLKAKLDDEQNRIAACAVLAGTNIPQAAEQLAKLAATQPNIIPYLVRLGNLAVPELAESAKKSEEWTMDALVDIGTPQAALALQPLLWSDESRAYQVAWRLAALLPLSGVEDALQTVALTPEHRKAKQIEWIWEPFSDNAILRIIVGRIAYLLQTTPKNKLPSKGFHCDPRLTLGLSTIAAQDTQLEKYEKRNPDAITLKSIVASPDALSKHPVWRRLFSTLSIEKQFDLVHLLLSEEKRLPSIDDWRDQFKPVSYDFLTSWHIKGVRVLLFILILLNLIGIGWQLDRSASLLTWENAFSLVISLIMLISVIIAVRLKEKSDLAFWLLVMFAGTGTAFGVIAGDLTHKWMASILVGILGSVLSSAIIKIFFIVMAGDRRDSVVKESVGLRVVLLNLLLSALFGFWSSALNSSFVAILALVLASIILFVIPLVVLDTRNWSDNTNLDFTLSNPRSVQETFGRLVVVVSSGFFDLILAYFATNFLYHSVGSIFTIIFWTTWLGIFLLMLFLSNMGERRMQNPLYGLFEPFNAAFSSRHPSRWLGRWFSFDK